jgi:hypothetical protein
MARKLHANDPVGVDLSNKVYALDSTTIDLCLSQFPWAPFRSTKAAVKLHTLLYLRGNIPTFLHISDGRLHNANIFDQLIPEAGAFYIVDRGYVDFERLARFDQAGAFFVTRAKRDMRFKRLAWRKTHRSTGVIYNHTIALTVCYSKQDYPKPLRRVRFKDRETGKKPVFLTNHLDLEPLTVCQLYKMRWQVELFFKWIKQHLRIKAFFGTSENAVKSQIWIAVCTDGLVAIVRKRLKLEASMHEILQILSLTLFEKTPLGQLLTLSMETPNQPGGANQLIWLNNVGTLVVGHLRHRTDLHRRRVELMAVGEPALIECRAIADPEPRGVRPGLQNCPERPPGSRVRARIGIPDQVQRLAGAQYKALQGAGDHDDCGLRLIAATIVQQFAGRAVRLAVPEDLDALHLGRSDAGVRHVHREQISRCRRRNRRIAVALLEERPRGGNHELVIGADGVVADPQRSGRDDDGTDCEHALGPVSMEQ